MSTIATGRCTEWCDGWSDGLDGNGDKIGSWCSAGGAGKVYCNLCKCAVSIKCGGKSRIIDHSKTMKHKERASSVRKTSKLTMMLDLVPRNQDDITDRITDAEIRFAVLLAEEDLAFLKADHIPKTLSKMFPDSKIASNMQIARQKATYVVNFGVSLYYSDELTKQLENVRYSLLIDEGSLGDRKWLAVLCRHHVDGQVKTHFLFAKSVSDARAIDIKELILSGLAEKKVNIHECLAIMCDSANVMRGQFGGVIALLQQEVPGILDIGGCVLHHVHNACSRAMCAIGEDIEELLDDIHNYLRYAKAANEFVKVQEFLGLEPLRYLRRVETRWLQIREVVDRHINLHDSLLEFFRSLPKSEKDKPKVKRILMRLEAPDTLAYLGFVSSALKPFSQFEKFFQTSKSIIHLLYSSMNDLFADVLHSFVRPSVIESMESFDEMIEISTEHQLCNENLIIGDIAKKSLRDCNITAVMRARFFSKVRQFHSSLLRALHHYLPMKQRLLKSIQMIDPGKKELVTEKDVVYLARKLGFCGDLDALKLEWRHFQSTHFEVSHTGTSCSVDEFWNGIQKQNKFPSLNSVASRALLIPHGNADTERLFSTMKKLLTKDRNRLQNPSINGLLMVKAYHQAREMSASSMVIDNNMRVKVRSASSVYQQQLKKAAAQKQDAEDDLLRKQDESETEKVKKEAEIRERKRKEDREEKRKLALEHMELARKIMKDLSEDNEQSEPNAKKKKIKKNSTNY